MKQNNDSGFDSIGSVATAKVPLNDFTLGFPRGFERAYKNLHNDQRQYFNDMPTIQEQQPYILNPNSIRANLKKQQKDYEYGRAMDRVLNTERSDRRYTQTPNGMGIQLKPINHVKFAPASYGANAWPASEDQNGPWQIRYFGEQPFYGIHTDKERLYNEIESKQPKVKPEKLEGGLRYRESEILVQNMLKDRVDQLNAIDLAKANFNTAPQQDMAQTQPANILPTGDLIELNLHLQGILDSLSSVYEGEDSNRNITALNSFILKDAQKTVLLVIKLAQKMDRTELTDLQQKIQQIIYWAEKIANKDQADLANRALGGEEFILENEEPGYYGKPTLSGPIQISSDSDRSRRKEFRNKEGNVNYESGGFDFDNYGLDVDEDIEQETEYPEELDNKTENIKDIVGYETAETLKQIFRKLETYVQQMINGINLTAKEKMQLSNAWVKELKFGQSIKSIDEVDSRIKNIMRQQGYNVYQEEAKDKIRGIKRGKIDPVHAEIDEFDIGDRFNPGYNLSKKEQQAIKKQIEKNKFRERQYAEDEAYLNQEYDPDYEEQRAGEYFQDDVVQQGEQPTGYFDSGDQYAGYPQSLNSDYFNRGFTYNDEGEREPIQDEGTDIFGIPGNLGQADQKPQVQVDDALLRRQQAQAKGAETRRRNAAIAREAAERKAAIEAQAKLFIQERNSIDRMDADQLIDYLNSQKFRKYTLSDEDQLLYDRADDRLKDLKESSRTEKAAQTRESNKQRAVREAREKEEARKAIRESLEPKKQKNKATKKSSGKGRVQRFYDPKTGQYNIARN